MRLEPQFRETPEADRQHPRRDARTGSRSRCASSPTSASPTARRSSTARTTRATSACSTRSRAAISRARCEDAQRQVAKRCQLPTGYRMRLGRRVRGVHGVARAAAASSLPITIVLIFMLLFVLYHNFKFPLITVVGVLLSAPARRPAGAEAHRDAVLRVVGDRLPRAVRRVGADGGRLHLLRERAAPATGSGSPRRRARRPCCDCGRS